MSRGPLSVAVIIPVYNVAPFVRQAVLSVLEMTVPAHVALHVVIVDDGSTDGSGGIVRDLLADRPATPSTTLISLESNVGLSAARNTALDHAEQEDFVLFVDSDDEVAKDMLERLVEHVEETVDVVVGSLVPFHPDGVVGRPIFPPTTDDLWDSPQAIRAVLDLNLRTFVINRLFRRELFKAITFPVGAIYEDIPVMAEVLTRCRRVALAPAAIYRYRQHPRSITANSGIRQLDLLHNVDEALAIFKGADGPVHPERSCFYFRFRGGVLPTAAAAARGRSPESAAVLRAAAAQIRMSDVLTAARFRLLSLGAGLLLLRADPRLYALVYRHLRKLRAGGWSSRRFAPTPVVLPSSTSGDRSWSGAIRSASVSCVIPTHRRPEQLQRALMSVLTQSLTPTEVVVTDDEGTPRSRALVADLQTSVPVRYIQVDRNDRLPQTAGRSRNVGAGTARGHFVAFLDDDDEWQPGFLRACVDLLHSSRADIAVAWTDYDTGSKRWPGVNLAADVTAADCLHHNPGFTGSNFVMTSEAFRRLGGFDPRLVVNNDLDLFVRALDAGLRYAVVEERMVTQFSQGGDHLSSRGLRRAHGLATYMDKYRTRLTRSQIRFLRRERCVAMKYPGQRRHVHLAWAARGWCNTSPSVALELLRHRFLGTGSFYDRS